MAHSAKSSTSALLSLVRSVLNMAAELEWLDKVPKIKMYKEPEGRVRFLTVEEAQTLLAELPEHIADMVIFSLSTGLRYSNVRKLEWNKIDLAKTHMWVESMSSKNKKAIAVPLNAQALAVLHKQVGKHATHVFTKAGKLISKANGPIWTAALKRAGITDFRWHDLRHTWASWHVQNGTRINELQILGA